ncbi:unnamed protein product [Cunninghamella echinulata]
MSACPFSQPLQTESGCPFGTSQAPPVETPGTNLGEQMAKCTTYQSGGCPIDNKAKDDIEDLLSVQAPRTLSLNGKVLDRFLPETYPSKMLATQENHVILDDPQLASAMRVGTKAVHKAAENSKFTRRFLKGDITIDEYSQYILSLYFVYKKMEELLEKYQEDPAIEMIYFPDELNREQALLKDLEYFYGKEDLETIIQPDSMTPAVKQYVQAMENACKINPALMVSHSYARYLGDLSGGQILAKRLKKHILHLEKTDGTWDSNSGLSFYYFNNIGNQNEFKNMYRQQLDEAPVTEHLKNLIVEEAVRCFELNIALFDEIQNLSDNNQLTKRTHNENTHIKNNYPVTESSNLLPIPALATVITGLTVITIGYATYAKYKAN